MLKSRNIQLFMEFLNKLQITGLHGLCKLLMLNKKELVTSSKITSYSYKDNCITFIFFRLDLVPEEL